MLYTTVGKLQCFFHKFYTWKIYFELGIQLISLLSAIHTALLAFILTENSELWTYFDSENRNASHYKSSEML